MESDIKGYLITVPSGPRPVITFKPQSVATTAESFATAIKFFNSFFYNLPDVEEDCRVHFDKLYDSLPKDVAYFYGVKTEFNLDDNPINRFCHPIGVGEDVEDAYSTFLLSPHWENGNPAVVSESGHFVKATFVGDEMKFEKIDEDYELTKKSAQVRSREKLKKIMLSQPMDEAPIPEDLKYSSYFSNITIKYAAAIEKQNATVEFKQMNERFQEAERNFYDSYKLYREYKMRETDAARSAALIQLVVQGAKIGADLYTAENSTVADREVQQLKHNQEVLSKEVDKSFNDLNMKLKVLEDRKHTNIIIFQKNGVPLNEDPKIDQKWPSLIH